MQLDVVSILSVKTMINSCSFVDLITKKNSFCFTSFYAPLEINNAFENGYILEI